MTTDALYNQDEKHTNLYMNTEIIRIIIEVVLGGTSLISILLYYGANKRIKQNEANKSDVDVTAARYELYEQRLEHANSVIEQHNSTILAQGETITSLNRALDDKTARIRKISDDLYQSEREKNTLNDKLVETTEKIGKLELRIDKLTRWKCHDSNCPNRRPESPTIKNKNFNDEDA